jgi:hypothetical protein
MIDCIDSFETEGLVKLIAQKRSYLKKVENPTQAKYIQREILFLENEILPVVMRQTEILYDEVTKWIVKCMHELTHCEHVEDYNGAIFYLHFGDNIKTKLKMPIIVEFSTIDDAEFHCTFPKVKGIPAYSEKLYQWKKKGKQNKQTEFVLRNTKEQSPEDMKEVWRKINKKIKELSK